MGLRRSWEGLVPFAAALADGTPVVVRALGPSDERELREWFQRLSPDARYQRFHAYVSNLPPDQWRYLTSADGIDHVALVASIAGQLVGVARLIRLGSRRDAAEIAFLVSDETQRKGLGSILRDALLAVVENPRIRTLFAHVLPENVAIRRLLATPTLQLVADTGHMLEITVG